MKVWFIDDQASNRRHWRKSFPKGIAGLELRTFDDVDSILSALSGETPDILFIDFFLGDRSGQEVIDWIRDRQRDPLVTRTPPVLIAHSSVESASRRMTANGADFFVPKEKAGGVIPAIKAAIRTKGDLEKIVRTRRWPA